MRAVYRHRNPGAVTGQRFGKCRRGSKRARLGVKVSWVKIDNLHLTLQFLGEVEASKLETVKAALDAVAARYQSMELTMAGVGAFPGDRHPRILWVGCEDGAGQLKGLAESIHHAMTPLGFPGPSTVSLPPI